MRSALLAARFVGGGSVLGRGWVEGLRVGGFGFGVLGLGELLPETSRLVNHGRGRCWFEEL